MLKNSYPTQYYIQNALFKMDIFASRSQKIQITHRIDAILNPMIS